MKKILILFLVLSNACHGTIISQWLLNDNLASQAVLDTESANDGATDSGNTSVISVSGPAGEANTAFTFATARYVIIGNIGAYIDKSFTYTGWMKTNNGTGSFLYIVSESLTSGTNNLSAIAIQSGALKFRIKTATGDTTVTGGSIDDDEWHFVAATSNGTTMTLYLDQLTPVTGSHPTGTHLSDNTKIGALENSSGVQGEFDGEIADVRMYDTTLTAGEIETIRQEMVGVSDAGTRGRYTGNYRSRYNF